MPAELLGHYRIVEQIGAGGMGSCITLTMSGCIDTAIKALPAGKLGIAPDEVVRFAIQIAKRRQAAHRSWLANCH